MATDLSEFHHEVRRLNYRKSDPGKKHRRPFLQVVAIWKQARYSVQNLSPVDTRTSFFLLSKSFSMLRFLELQSFYSSPPHPIDKTTVCDKAAYSSLSCLSR